jgi:hypothetical protein
MGAKRLMPHLELTELECKVAWLVLDQHLMEPAFHEAGMAEAERTLFAKVYRAYRGIPEAA